MRIRYSLAMVVSTVCAVALTGMGLGGAAVASAAPAPALMSVAVPTCQLASPETINGVQFVNGQFVNGTWTYSTGVACTANLGDIALYEELDLNGVKVHSKLKNFTGVARPLDAITANVPCSVCNGTWVFKWGQILKAPAGFMFTGAMAGCVILQSGLYELCVQTRTVTL